MKSCPVCRLFLEEREWRGVSALACASCGGVWLNGTEFDGISAAPESPLSELDTLVAAASQGNVFQGLLRLCPDCLTAPLEPVTIEAMQREVHRCARCRGVWWQPDPTRITLRTSPEPAAPTAPLPDDAEPPTLTTETVTTTTEDRPDPSAALPLEPPEGPVTPPTLGLVIETDMPEPPEPPVRDAEDAWKRLVDGNARFAAGHGRRPRSTTERGAEVVAGQHPFAVVMCCSDSRVPPEIVFDQGIGDLFVVRTAGHVLTQTSTASILYAVDHLHVPLVVVLGHTECGAVTAATSASESLPAYIGPLRRAILPAVEMARSVRGDLVRETVRIHAATTARRILEAIRSAVPEAHRKQVQVVAAMYDLRSCLIERLPDVPEPPKASEPSRSQPAPPQPPAQVAPPPAAPPVQTGASDEMAPPGGNATSRFPRWCPRCRGGFGPRTALCPRCGVVLVQPWYRVPCLKCNKDNLIGLDRCWNCRADLHPDTRDSDEGPPPAPEVLLRSGTRVPRDGTQNCSTGMVVWAVVAALGYVVLSRLL